MTSQTVRQIGCIRVPSESEVQICQAQKKTRMPAEMYAEMQAKIQAKMQIQMKSSVSKQLVRGPLNFPRTPEVLTQKSWPHTSPSSAWSGQNLDCHQTGKKFVLSTN